MASVLSDNATTLPSPLDQPFYSCERLAEIFDLSANYVRRLFSNEPDVVNLGDRRIILRIPHSAVVRILTQRAIGAKKSNIEKFFQGKNARRRKS